MSEDKKELREALWKEIQKVECDLTESSLGRTIQSVQYKRELIGMLTDLLQIDALLTVESKIDSKFINEIRELKKAYRMKHAVQFDAGHKEQALYYKGCIDSYEYVWRLLME